MLFCNHLTNCNVLAMKLIHQQNIPEPSLIIRHTLLEMML